MDKLSHSVFYEAPQAHSGGIFSSRFVGAKSSEAKNSSHSSTSLRSRFSAKEDKIIKYWLPVIVWAIIIFLFSSYPTEPVSKIYLKDFIVKKLAHVVEYGVLTVLIYRALKETGMPKKEAGFCAIILAVLYGVSDEFHQSFTPGREPKARDVIFDTIGSVGSIYVVWKLLPRLPEKLKAWVEKSQVL